MRAVLDPNVIISALLSPTGRPAQLLGAWQRGEYDLIVSPLLLEELERALAYPKLRRYISEDEAAAVLNWLAESATVVVDPPPPLRARSVDPGDDHLIALAAFAQAILVSGDKHLLDLAAEIPVLPSAVFLEHLSDESERPG